MSGPDSLKEIYHDELADLWSANDQMAKVLGRLAGKVQDETLKDLFENSVSGISGHTATIKALLEAGGGEVAKEHCKGMEGLVKEAIKHGEEEAPEDDDLQAIVLIAQYQRMSHYGIAGFGSASAYAAALGRQDDVKKLKGIVADIYKADNYTSKLGEKLAKTAGK
ncbi:ferritin-like domain-containing protein [Acidisoma sp.]|uniref:YciE/YciF ferroxidase family protein n=1 Tax=Acidisoma sp. TaxID=1872115 RepID=UPI003AFFAD7D